MLMRFTYRWLECDVQYIGVNRVSLNLSQNQSVLHCCICFTNFSEFVVIGLKQSLVNKKTIISSFLQSSNRLPNNDQ